MVKDLFSKPNPAAVMARAREERIQEQLKALDYGPDYYKLRIAGTSPVYTVTEREMGVVLATTL